MSFPSGLRLAALAPLAPLAYNFHIRLKGVKTMKTTKAERAQRVLDVESLRKRTHPPRRFTEGTLLTAMETAGQTLDEKELSDAMKETGLGTPATRAQIIEVLLKRAYIVREGKSLQATDKGVHLIQVVHPEVKSPAMTGQWEAYLKRIHRRTAQLQPFLERAGLSLREGRGEVALYTR